MSSSRPKLCLGTHGIITVLRKHHVLTDRTTRQITIDTKNAVTPGSGLIYCQELTVSNILDLYKVISWCYDHGILFYRMTSSFAPHITDPKYIPKSRQKDYTALAYSLEPFRPLFATIGRYARNRDIRLTFHPGQFTLLNPLDQDILVRSLRDLHFHCTVLDMMGMGPDSVCVIHGGGTYDDKAAAEARWIATYRKLPEYIRQRIVLENDEESYSIEDVIRISKAVDTPTRLPIVFDLFHHQCYDRKLEAQGLPKLRKPEYYMPDIVRSWGTRTVKMHYSEQKPEGSNGAHSDYVREIPRLFLTFPKKYHRSLDLMIEAKMTEQATLRMIRKYKLY